MLESVPPAVHMVGVAGAGMSGLAKLLVQIGHRVSGSDLRPGPILDSLGALGIDVWSGHRPERVGQWDLLVASSAVPAHDPEVSAATAAGIEVWRRPDLLAALTTAMPAMGVTGTHGKTTGTALAVAALRAVGRDPSFMVGGQLLDLATNAHLGERELFVLEADEAFGTFLRLTLTGLVVTNIEADHLDHYETLERLFDAFEHVAASVTGPVLVCVDDAGSRRLAALGNAITYGTDASARWRLVDVQAGPEGVGFRLTAPGRSLPVFVPRPGIHTARNAAGVLGLVGELGFDLEAAAAGVARFGGLRRRFETKGRVGGVTVIDDYAHHPTEVAATLGAARPAVRGRLWAVFQPHRYSRTALHGAALGTALAAADRVVVTDVYAAGEIPVPGVDGRSVADAASGAGAVVDYVPHRVDVAGTVAAQTSEGDVVVTMGAGDITVVGDELLALLGGRE